MWVFDLKSRKGRKLDLPGKGFANDLAVPGGALFANDNRNDLLYRVGPADFCVIPDDKGFMVAVPDLVQSQLRIVRLGK